MKKKSVGIKPWEGPFGDKAQAAAALWAMAEGTRWVVGDLAIEEIRGGRHVMNVCSEYAAAIGVTWRYIYECVSMSKEFAPAERVDSWGEMRKLFAARRKQRQTNGAEDAV